MFGSRLLRPLAGLALAAAAALVPGAGAQAQAITCGQPYTVGPGDTLSRIAQRAYGSVSAYQIIYSANAEAIGRTPSVVRLGTVLNIPCLDAAGVPSTADAAAIRPAETTETLPPPEALTIRVLTASDWAPFLDENQEQGGMLAEIANVALTRATGSPKFKIDFINDWGAHIQPLLSDHAYDLGLAWFRPNCDAAGKLSDENRFRCNNLDWSDPLFELIVGYYTLKGYPAPRDHSALLGARICRPAGYSTFMLEENDLSPPYITLIRPAGPAEAFGMLLDGKCDVVVLAVDVAEDAIAAAGATDKVMVHENLSQVASLHAVISRTHPRAREILAVFNDGLAKIKSDGTWFGIVQRHMAEHRAKSRAESRAESRGG